MLQKSIEAIIAQGVRDMEHQKEVVRGVAEQAKATVSQCQSEISSLVNLAKQVPEKVFDRYTHVLVSTFEMYDEARFSHGYIQINTSQGQLHGIMGDEKIKRGKYRVIVLVEPIS